MAKDEYTVGEDRQQPSVMRGGPGANMAAGEKADNFKASILQLVRYSRRYLPAILIAVVLAIAGSILNIVGPGMLSDITDLITGGLQTGIDVDAVVRIAGLLAVLYGLGLVFNLIQGIMMSDISQRTSKRLRSDI